MSARDQITFFLRMLRTTLRPLTLRRTFTFKPLYTAEVVASGGRNGSVRSPDGVLALALSLPKALGGPGGHVANPEYLFAAAYSACFSGALELAAKQGKVILPETSVSAQVHIGKDERGGLGLETHLTVRADGRTFS